MAKIYYADLYGKRKHKFEILLSNDLTTIDWIEVKPEAPFYLFCPQNTELLPEYNQGFKVTEIFPINSVGIVTGKDAETIAFSYEEAEKLSTKHKITKDKILPILYRTFDVRFIVYDSKVITRPRTQVMRHMLLGNVNNLGLIARRQMLENNITYFYVSQDIISDGVIRSDNKGSESIFPLYIYPEKENNQGNLLIEKTPNLSANFLQAIKEKLGYIPTPENIFYYTYAVFHSPTYRQRYREFLKIDFPRLPLTSNDKLFKSLAKLGEELVRLHLMESPKLNKLITKYEGQGESIVSQVTYQEKEERIYLNKTKYFSNIKPEIWKFKIGGYQVLDKWLKDRKKANRSLSFDDILHYQKIVVALKETKDLMIEIDKTIGNFPID